MTTRATHSLLLLSWMAIPVVATGQDKTPSTTPIQPLLKNQWGQRGLYAQFAPNHERLGCWSVALAQILYYHKIQPTGEVSYAGKGYRVQETLDHAFRWDRFTDTVTPATPPEKQEEVAKYCYYTAIAIGRDFSGQEAYQGDSDARRKGLARHYGCTTRRYRSEVEGPEAVRRVIRSELAEGRPLLLDAEPHAFVIDGARGGSPGFEVHLNCGWGGVDNGWYAFERPFRTSLGLLGGTSRWVMTIRPPVPRTSGNRQ